MGKQAITKVGYKPDSDGVLQKFEINQTFNWGEEPSYVKVYLQDVFYLRNISKTYLTVMYALLERVSFAGESNGMCVTVNKGVKKDICKEIGWNHPNSIDNAIQMLLKGKIIRRIDRGIYQFNPYIFGKGNWADIAKLRVSVSYDEEHGRTFETDFADVEEKDENDFWNEINAEG